jgi:hypothetical protein
VQNYFSVETEVAFRRRELERAIAAAELTARVRAERGRPVWWRLPLPIPARPRSLRGLRIPLAPWWFTAKGQSAPHP